MCRVALLLLALVVLSHALTEEKIHHKKGASFKHLHHARKAKGHAHLRARAGEPCGSLVADPTNPNSRSRSGVCGNPGCPDGKAPGSAGDTPCPSGEDCCFPGCSTCMGAVDADCTSLGGTIDPAPCAHGVCCKGALTSAACPTAGGRCVANYLCQGPANAIVGPQCGTGLICCSNDKLKCYNQQDGVQGTCEAPGSCPGREVTAQSDVCTNSRLGLICCIPATVAVADEVHVDEAEHSVDEAKVAADQAQVGVDQAEANLAQAQTQAAEDGTQ